MKLISWKIQNNVGKINEIVQWEQISNFQWELSNILISRFWGFFNKKDNFWKCPRQLYHSGYWIVARRVEFKQFRVASNSSSIRQA